MAGEEGILYETPGGIGKEIEMPRPFKDIRVLQERNVIFDGETAEWFFTTMQGEDWDQVAFRRGCMSCPECNDPQNDYPHMSHDVSSIFPSNTPDEYSVGLHWCACGAIWLDGYGEPIILLTSEQHVKLMESAVSR